MKLRVLLIPAFTAMSSFLLMGVSLADPAPKVSEPAPLKKVRLQEAYGLLPLSFEPNQGRTDTQVKFLSRGQGYSLFLTSSGVVLALRSAASPSRAASLTSLAKHPQPATDSIDAKAASIKETQRPDRRDDATDAPTQKTQSTVLRMHLIGANLSPALKGLEELPGKVNSFIGKDTRKWRTNIPTYSKVKYQEVYPGVDVIYYGNQRQLEFDFIVAPGADPNQIKLSFEGAKDITLDEGGDLILKTESGELRLRKPLVYQQDDRGHKHLIAGNYVLLASVAQSSAPALSISHRPSAISHSVGIQVASYDRSRPLVIDPTLFYSTYLGGNGDDQSFSIAVDAAGNAYVTGFTASSNFPTTTGAFQTTLTGVNDVFVTKLNPTGSGLVYSTYLGGSGGELGRGIVVDASGNAYLTGSTASSDFPTTTGAFQTTFAGVDDVFVTKLNPTGSELVYSTYLGGNSEDRGSALAVDTLGQAYVTGKVGNNYPTTPGTYEPIMLGSGGSAFVTKLNPTGTGLLYSTFLSAVNDISAGLGITVDASGNAFVTGTTAAGTFPTTAGVFDTTFNGGPHDTFVTELNATGSALVYSTFLGGSLADNVHGIALDASGSAYVTGATSSTNFPTTLGAFQTTFNGAGDAFVTKLNSAGSGLIYSTYLGGSEGDDGVSITVDISAKAFIAGTTGSSNFPTSTGAFQTANAGATDAFVTVLNAAGSGLILSTYLGGNLGDEGRGIAIDQFANAYVTGTTNSTTFPVTSGAFQTTFGGGPSDAFAAKIIDVVLPPAAPAGKVTGGGTVNVPNGEANSGFIVQREVPGGPVEGHLQYNNHASGAKVRSVTFTSFFIAGNTATFEGTCTNNGAACTFTVTVVDNGEPGTNDAFTITISGGTPEGGTLRSGNIQIHD